MTAYRNLAHIIADQLDRECLPEIRPFQWHQSWGKEQKVVFHHLTERVYTTFTIKELEKPEAFLAAKANAAAEVLVDLVDGSAKSRGVDSVGWVIQDEGGVQYGPVKVTTGYQAWEGDYVEFSILLAHRDLVR